MSEVPEIIHEQLTSPEDAPGPESEEGSDQRLVRRLTIWIGVICLVLLSWYIAADRLTQNRTLTGTGQDNGQEIRHGILR